MLLTTFILSTSHSQLISRAVRNESGYRLAYDTPNFHWAMKARCVVRVEARVVVDTLIASRHSTVCVNFTTTAVCRLFVSKLFPGKAELKVICIDIWNCHKHNVINLNVDLKVSIVPDSIGHWGLTRNHWGPTQNHWGPTHNHWGPTRNHWGPTRNHWGWTYKQKRNIGVWLINKYKLLVSDS